MNQTTIQIKLLLATRYMDWNEREERQKNNNINNKKNEERRKKRKDGEKKIIINNNKKSQTQQPAITYIPLLYHRIYTTLLNI